MPAERSDFAQTWLQPGAPNPAYTALDHRPLREVAGTRNDILVALTQAVVDHHSHLNRVNNWIETLGFANTKVELDKQLQLNHRTKMGNFGEVIASEALIQREGYSMPVFKLRYRDSKLPMRGEDIVAFRIDNNGKIDLLIVGEAKAYAAYAAQAVEKALERLDICYNPHPQTLNLLAEILYGANRDVEAKAIDELIVNLATKQITQEHWIVFVTGNQHADPFACINTPRLGPRVICVDLPLSDLTNLVNTVFTPSVHWENP
jgi:hypothetical protein